MIPAVLAGLFVVGAAGVLGVGVVRIFRRREIGMSDYLELPPPRPDDGGQAQADQ
jgi:hypothetical protein